MVANVSYHKVGIITYQGIENVKDFFFKTNTSSS